MLYAGFLPELNIVNHPPVCLRFLQGDSLIIITSISILFTKPSPDCKKDEDSVDMQSEASQGKQEDSFQQKVLRFGRGHGGCKSHEATSKYQGQNQH